MKAAAETIVALGPRVGSGRTSEVFRHGASQVVKLYVPGHDPETIETEFAATKLAWSLGLPVAEPFSTIAFQGRTGIVFAYLAGQTIVGRNLRNPVGFLLAFRRLALVQAAIHACPATGLPPQRTILQDQIAKARVSETVRRAALSALDRLPDADRLCHGDLHANNALCTPGGLRIIDWHLATSGHPAADVARTVSMIRYGQFRAGRIDAWLHLDGLRAAMAWSYLRCYARASAMPLSEIRAWWLPTLAARLSGRVSRAEDELRRVAKHLAAEHLAAEHLARERAEAPPEGSR